MCCKQQCANSISHLILPCRPKMWPVGQTFYAVQVHCGEFFQHPRNDIKLMIVRIVVILTDPYAPYPPSTQTWTTRWSRCTKASAKLRSSSTLSGRCSSAVSPTPTHLSTTLGGEAASPWARARTLGWRSTSPSSRRPVQLSVFWHHNDQPSLPKLPSPTTAKPTALLLGEVVILTSRGQ